MYDENIYSERKGCIIGNDHSSLMYRALVYPRFSKIHPRAANGASLICAHYRRVSDCPRRDGDQATAAPMILAPEVGIPA
jgi:hypothetical protein